MDEPLNQPNGWKPPIPVGDERLQCVYCTTWSCPRWYQNQSGARVEGGRDGYTRMAAHVDAEHYLERRKAKMAARGRRRYAERKAVNAALAEEGRS